MQKTNTKLVCSKVYRLDICASDLHEVRGGERREETEQMERGGEEKETKTIKKEYEMIAKEKYSK